ncbi:MAG: hypothetical protein LBB23_02735 [Rickettsiales bacterium]|jgi:hypothetical protein|nr:hypothetical protein [Rickettsiales bacterium]
MLKFISIFALVALGISTADAAVQQNQRGGQQAARVAAGGAMGGAAPRAVAVPAVRAATGIGSVVARAAEDTAATATAANTTAAPVVSAADEALAAAQAAAEVSKANCLANNVGIAGAFVWASKAARSAAGYSTNGASLAQLTEDAGDPSNNTCWIRVELSSDQSGVNLSSIRASYFAENDPVTCGSWANKKDIESQILKATASSRNWATFAGVAGGAVVGVTGMELVGMTSLGKKTGHSLDDGAAKSGAFGIGGTDADQSKLFEAQYFTNQTSKFNAIRSDKDDSNTLAKIKGQKFKEAVGIIAKACENAGKSVDPSDKCLDLLGNSNVEIESCGCFIPGGYFNPTKV